VLSERESSKKKKEKEEARKMKKEEGNGALPICLPERRHASL